MSRNNRVLLRSAWAFVAVPVAVVACSSTSTTGSGDGGADTPSEGGPAAPSTAGTASAKDSGTPSTSGDTCNMTLFTDGFRKACKPTGTNKYCCSQLIDDCNNGASSASCKATACCYDKCPMTNGDACQADCVKKNQDTTTGAQLWKTIYNCATAGSCSVSSC